MSKILLFGTNTAAGVPMEVIQWLQVYLSQGHEFIVSDKKGLDCNIHKVLSSIGAIDKSTIYCMGKPNNNIYNIPIKSFNTLYNEDAKKVTIVDADTNEELLIIDDVNKEADIAITRQWYEFRDRQMIEDCAIGICIYDEQNNTTRHMIQLMNIKNKPCYCVQVG